MSTKVRAVPRWLVIAIAVIVLIGLAVFVFGLGHDEASMAALHLIVA